MRPFSEGSIESEPGDRGDAAKERGVTQESISQRVRIRSLLDAVERPCWVVRPDGHVVVRNASARELRETPSWVVELAADRSSELPVDARSRHVRIDGESLRLAIGPRSNPTEAFDFASLGLDETHVEIAEHLLRGFSDVEIALIVGKPIGTVHAWIVQVNRLLGVRTRTELVALVHRARDEASAEATRDSARAERTRSTIESLVGERRSIATQKK